MGKTLGSTIFAVVFFAFTTEASTFYLAYQQHVTGNLFQTSDSVSDRISSFSLSLDKDFSALSLMAEARYSLFHENSGLSFFGLDTGLDYLKPLGVKSALYFAAGASGTFFRSEFAPFSFLSLDAAAAFKSYLTPTSILKVQWLGGYRAYRDSLFDSVSQTASLSLDKYFASKTTVQAEAGFGYKRFLHPFLPAPLEPLAVPAMSGMQSGETAGPTSGWGGGLRYQGGYGFVPRTSASGGGVGIGHVSLSGLLAQGIGGRLGLSVSGLRQWTVSGENPFLSIEEFYYAENPSSDSFSWEGWAVTPRLTLQLPWNIGLKIGYTVSERSYPGIECLSPEGEPLGITRSDRREIIEARLEKAFAKFTVFAAYSRLDNRSNDPLFTWKSPFFLAGIEWNVPLGRKE